MKHFLLAFFIALFPTLPCMAQELKDPLDAPPPRIIVQTGIGLQWFAETFKMFTVSVERPIGHFWHLGLQGNKYLGLSDEYFDYRDFLGGFEVSGFSKYFLHGRFSGRKTGLYFGPEIRFGARRYQSTSGNIFPPPPNPEFVQYKERTTKILMRWGAQWQFGHANLELTAPFGMEYFKPPLAYNLGGHQTRFVLLPAIQLGFAF